MSNRQYIRRQVGDNHKTIIRSFRGLSFQLHVTPSSDCVSVRRKSTGRRIRAGQFSRYRDDITIGILENIVGYLCAGRRIDFYEVNGQTLFPIYGNDGGLAASFITYLWWGWNLASENLRAGCYSTGNGIPTGYFGH